MLHFSELGIHVGWGSLTCLLCGQKQGKTKLTGPFNVYCHTMKNWGEFGDLFVMGRYLSEPQKYHCLWALMGVWKYFHFTNCWQLSLWSTPPFPRCIFLAFLFLLNSNGPSLASVTCSLSPRNSAGSLFPLLTSSTSVIFYINFLL